ncbi:unnamed protein product [Auanema sp. JU1783]|nr:unnamed protein product [Auanema sp. JU1783]
MIYQSARADMSFHFNSYEVTAGGHDRGGKNVFTSINSDKHVKRRPSQFDRALHRLYAEPRHIFHNQLADRLFHRFYWIVRSVQFKIFYRNEEIDVDEAVEKWEVAVKPPSLDELAQKTQFDPRWLKYMYSKFKNECPNGRMKEPEFRVLLSSIIAPEKATDQYLSRLFTAFSNEDHKTITFQNLIECLAHLNPQSAESNAQWTIRLITGSASDQFAFPDFLSFTQSVFALNEGKNGFQECNRETILQRAEKIFQELDSDNDGFVTSQDMIRFFQNYNVHLSPPTRTDTYTKPPKSVKKIKIEEN